MCVYGVGLGCVPGRVSLLANAQQMPETPEIR